ncbi:MAG: hypothetical protein ACOYJB_05165 [Christensenellaceae bacterium]
MDKKQEGDMALEVGKLQIEVVAETKGFDTAIRGLKQHAAA